MSLVSFCGTGDILFTARGRAEEVPMEGRIVYLDALRCLAMLLVVVLHSIATVIINPELYGTTSWLFCMGLDALDRMGVPLFFMISGCLMLGGEGAGQIGPFYRKNLPKLLVPLLVWNVVYFGEQVLRGRNQATLRAFLGELLDQGSGYHMWFVYVLLGIYLVCPFLKKMTDRCTSREILLLIALIMLPTTFRNLFNRLQPAVYLYLFSPMLEGFLGYFLLGYWLGSHRLGRRGRLVLYLLGVAGYLWGTAGNLLTASPAEIPLPYDSNYELTHYLCSAAAFVWVQTCFEKHRERLAPLARPLARLSGLTFGVYWVHVLILNGVTDWIGTEVSVAEYVALRLILTGLLSLAFAWAVSKIPVARKLLM